MKEEMGGEWGGIGDVGVKEGMGGAISWEGQLVGGALGWCERRE